jgi:hypothetical protein
VRAELRRKALESARVLRGGSMTPVLRGGDVLDIEPLTARGARPGNWSRSWRRSPGGSLCTGSCASWSGAS